MQCNVVFSLTDTNSVVHTFWVFPTPKKGSKIFEKRKNMLILIFHDE